MILSQLESSPELKEDSTDIKRTSFWRKNTVLQIGKDM